MKAPLRVMLADDHTLVRAGLHKLLDAIPSVEVVGEAGDGQTLLDLAAQHHPDVVLMDIAMPGLNGLEATARLLQDSPAVRVMILSMHQSEEYVRRARGHRPGALRHQDGFGIFVREIGL